MSINFIEILEDTNIATGFQKIVKTITWND